jgi:ATP-dependent DNA helicase RecQ
VDGLARILCEQLLLAHRDVWSHEGEPARLWRQRAVERAAAVLEDERATSLGRAVAGRHIVRLFRPDGGLSIRHPDLSRAFQAIDPGSLSRCGLTIDESFDGQPVLRARPLTWSARPELLPSVFELRPEDRRPAWEHLPGDAFWRRQLADGGPTDYRGTTQRSAVRAGALALPKGVLLVSLPTGAGKSLCALVPAAERIALRGGERRGTVVMIVPTLALMNDQRRAIKHEFSLAPGDVRTISSGDDSASREEAIRDLAQGRTPFVLMPPESAMNTAGRRALETCATIGRLDTLIIDEAHLITTWGASFRPAIQRLGEFRRRLANLNPRMVTILLSATATAEAERRLRRFFAGEDEQADPWLHVDGRALREEHDSVVCQFETNADRRDALHELVSLLPRPSIVYATEREVAATIFDELREDYARIALFTGATGPAERGRIIDDWAADRLDLVVATSAFGLGVDKPNVRAVVHAQLPESLDRFYQEVGRGGRDGFACLSIALVLNADVSIARGLVTRTLASSGLAAERWVSMRDKAREAKSPLGERAYSVDLNDRCDRVRQQAKESGKLNRSWNEAVLLLLERAGCLDIEPADTDADRRIVTPRSMWILEEDDAAIARRIEPHRQSERSRNDVLLDQLERVFADTPQRCLHAELANCYGLEDAWPPCGRCENCRRSGMKPSVGLPPRRVFEQWPEAHLPRPRQGRRAPWDGLCSGRVRLERKHTTPEYRKEIVLGLSRGGCEQFLLPPDLLAETAETIANQGTVAGLGLVGPLPNVDAQEHRGIAPVPTAVWLDGHDPMLAVRVGEKLSSLSPGAVPVIWLCPQDLRTFSGGSVWDLLEAERSWTWPELMKLLAR